MKNLFILLFFILGFSWTQAKDYSSAPERGILIGIASDKKAIKSTEGVKFSGVIKVINKEKDEDHAHEKGHDKKTLLQEFQKEGFDIVGTFPSEAVDISNNLEITSTNEKEIKFSFTASNINANDLNQFSVKVFNNHKNKELLKRLAQIKAKIEKRVLALHELKNKSKKENWSEKAIDYISKKTEVLNQLSQQIASNINSNESLLAQNTYALQVDNLTASSSQISTIMNKYRFVVSSEIGTAIDGMSTKINAAVTNLRKSDEKEKEDDDDDYKAAQFLFNGVALYTSSAKKLSGGESISYTYTTDKLLPSNSNEFSVALYHVEENKLKKRIGWVTQKIPVVPDVINPAWLTSSAPSSDAGTLYVQALDYVNLQAQDALGRIDSASFKAMVSGSLVSGESFNQDVSSKFSKLKIGEGWEYVFSADVNPLAEGLYNLEANVKDLAFNAAETKTINFRVDRTAPAIALSVPADALTNQLTYQVPIKIDDLSPTTTKVYVNEELQLTTQSTFFTATLNLTLEGANLVKVISTDAAGSIAVSSIKTIIRDTTLPMLSNLVPQNNSNIYQMQFPMSGNSNEKLKYVKVNNYDLNLSLDKLSFSGNYTIEMSGDLVLNIEYSDDAGNIAHTVFNVKVNNKLLNADLINISLAADGQRLSINGSSFASRPGALIKINAGIFSFNRAETTSNTLNGSFNLKLDYFETANISATDLSTGQTEEAVLHFDRTKTKLSGIIKDSNNNPLPGVTVKVTGSSNSYITDGNGLFVINNPSTGDQALIIDGSTIPQAVTGPTRKFYTTNVSINVGIGQNNVLERPIYLTPLLFDNSETHVLANTPTVVTSIHAPGVELSIPANAAIFPGGATNGAINVMKIASDFSTIPTPSFAVPSFVYSFEPSGLVFNKRVQLTLPNENELPAGVEFLVYSMNSAKGAWELDGLANVTSDGQSVVTKEGHGISHFSLIYVVPLSPVLAEVKNPNLLGVDISQGAVSSSIRLPSFKTLGSDVAPSLSYKSSWANPTAVTTNIIDIPEMKSEVSGTFNSSKYEYKTYQKTFCGFDRVCGEKDVNEFLLGLESTFIGTIKSWYEPEEIKGQFFISDITSEEARFGHVEGSDKYLEGSNFDNVSASKISTLNGKDIPRRSLASFSVELFNSDTGKYLQSGIYPTLTRYQIKLKNMTMLTGTNATKVTADGTFYKVIRTILDNKVDSKILENTLPKDILSTVLVQSKTESSYGRGWNLNGIQKIINTNGSRILIENEDGSLSTYALNNTISTLVNANNTEIDLSAAVDLNHWPMATLQRRSGNQSQVAQVNLASGVGSLSDVGVLHQETGLISSDGLYQCTIPAGCNEQVIYCNAGYTDTMVANAKYTPIQYSYAVKPNASGLTRAADGRIIGLDNKQHSLFQIYQGGYYQLAGYKSSVYDFVKNTTGAWRLDMNSGQISNFCKNTFGNECIFVRNASELTTSCSGHIENIAGKSVAAGTWQYCRSLDSFVGSNLPGSWGYTLGSLTYGMCLNNGGKFGYNVWSLNNYSYPLGSFSGQVGISGFSGQESQSGVGTNPTSIGLNNPRGIIISPEGHVIVADSGNNRVRRFNLYDNTVTTIAGNGGINDSGDGNAASSAEIFHPKELAYDGLGNLYISTEAGYIRKVDIDGKISTFAGLPLSKGGILGDDVHAEQMALNNPSGMVIDKDNGYMYVADTGNHRIVKIDLVSKNTTTVAGSGNCDTAGLADNSPALAASLCSPTYVGLDSSKNLIIVDAGHGLIRRVILNSGAAELMYLSSNKDSSKLIKNTDGTWVRTYRNGTKAYFNLKGNQTSISDRIGRAVNYEYNSEDLVTSIVSSATGQRTELSYTGSNKLSQIKDPAGRITSFNYSGNNLSSVNFPDGATKKYEYNAKGMLTKETNERNISVSYTYNGLNRIDTVSHSDGTSITIGDSASKTTNSGDIASELKNSGFGPTQINDHIVDARSAETEFTKDFMGIVSQIKDAQGKITKIEKDIEGKIKRITHADESVVEMTYDELTNDLLSTKNINLNITQSQTYNQFGQVTSNTNANNQTSISSYDPTTGLLLKQTNANGSFVSYEYDAKGLLTSKTVNTGSSTLTMQYEYDSIGNLKKVTDNDGKSINYIYDSAGNVQQSISTSTGSDQLITSYTYDDFNRIKSVKTPKNEITQYDYLATGELSQIIDPSGNTTVFEYDLKGRLSKKTSPDGSIHQFAYDANGNRTQEIDPNSNVKNYVYDELNKLTRVNLPDDTIAYTYDLRGEVASAQNSVSAVAYQKFCPVHRLFLNSKKSYCLSYFQEKYTYESATSGFYWVSSVFKGLGIFQNFTT